MSGTRTKRATCVWKGASGTEYTYHIWKLPTSIDPGQDGNYIYAKKTPRGGGCRSTSVKATSRSGPALDTIRPTASVGRVRRISTAICRQVRRRVVPRKLTYWAGTRMHTLPPAATNDPAVELGTF